MTLSDPNPGFKVTVNLEVEYLKNDAFYGASDSALMLTLCALQMLVLLLLLLLFVYYLQLFTKQSQNSQTNCVSVLQQL